MIHLYLEGIWTRKISVSVVFPSYYNSPTRMTFSAVEPIMRALLIAQQYAYNTSSKARGKGACGASE
jgi:hypothetical protein